MTTYDTQPSTLIRNAAAIMTGGRGTADDPSRVPGPDIRIVGDTIDEIGALAPRPGETIVDATDCVIYPAWVNTHHHLFQSLLKGDTAGLDATLTPWLAATPYRFRALFDERRFRLAARIGLIELARSGCATVADHNYVYYPGMPFDSSAILFEEAEKLGLRFVLLRGGATQTRQLEADLPTALRPETLDAYVADIERLAARYHDASPRAMRRVVMAPTTVLYSISPREMRETAAVARRLGLRMHSHLSETVGYQDSAYSMYGKSPVAFCGEHDWLGSDVWYAHLVKVDADEIALLAQTGTGVAHCPQSNGRLGSGICPVREMADAGVPVSIGVDGAASNEAADMISEVHMTWLAQRARLGMLAQPAYRGGSFEGGAGAASIAEVIHWGTAGGARVMGLDEVGKVAVGYAADIAVYRLDDPRYFGLHDPAIGPVASGGRPSVMALFSAGKRVVVDDLIEGVDIKELGGEARRVVRELLREVVV
ncbi:amidohydrolase family protein [Paraburkholderia fungorum]|uniref:Cytosine/adenosine deaminase-related metal-dependent hydrolase n=1 Tax=Paraburkholderia fungorum TaxID=134537 RepID=A0AAW3UWH8_9BURK|nr:amidohydrolase family protein [Paraburkholderia fungorum]MBB4514810.1 cytosine/adenosine deaminase-related metal-dependent hydrolase [Paraburkholderia fungorum]MBB5544547.1 cytosine/adenosine deaminase-related metal-dependent hydrolase [Paraburkholderia fungorum]MBB6202754.1 cytosine/adenosine deaminase-related metal-dependent hydrolase [Paraburkholderia fungorum]PNE55915.1 amidohydrolase [Paraburkholderia fungorum]QLD50215.1 amidohydrolase [Paraburkholderia fungorum]